jgi:hypothetical protein
MIVVLAGRRVDAPGADNPRFPAENAALVQEHIYTLLQKRKTRALVCSAACGADLLALEVAGHLAIRRRVVIPFQPDLFRQTSVVDRPGDWGEKYDRILNEVEHRGDLVVLGYNQDDQEAYPATNQAMLAQALMLGHEEHLPVIAVVVWNGEPRGKDDVTEAFRQEARNQGLPVSEIKTLW